MAHAPPQNKYFVTTSLGLERSLEREVRALGVSAVRRVAGGVSFRGPRAAMVEACLKLRTAHRVLWMLGSFPAPDLDALYRGVRSEVRWRGLLTPEHTVAVHATTRQSSIRDTRIIALKTKDAIVDSVRDAFGERPSVARHDPDVRVHVRLNRDRVEIGLDAAGQSLHERGYRTDAGRAPLRETLAAGILGLMDWDGSTPLYDPMCGSGTFVIEAALIAAGKFPGQLGRNYGFERWPGFKPARLAKLKEALRHEHPESMPPIVGSDRNPRAIKGARDNAKRAGVSHLIRFELLDARQVRAPKGPPGLVVCNPPYGERLGSAPELDSLFRKLGHQLRAEFPEWRAAFLLGQESHQHALGLDVERVNELKQGPLDIRLAQFAAIR